MGCNLCPQQGEVDTLQVAEYNPRNRERSEILSPSVFSSSRSSSSLSLPDNPPPQPSEHPPHHHIPAQTIDINTLFEIYLNLRANASQNPALQTQDIFVGFVNFLQMVSILQPNEGLTQQQIDQMPRVGAPHSEATCPICHETIMKGQQQLALSCHHPFHASCLGQWLVRSKKCPMCRQQINYRQN